MKISDMSQRGVSDILRYESVDAPEGFNFIYVQNRNKTNTYVEEMTYTVFEGVQIMEEGGPANNGRLEIGESSYRLTVPSMSNYMILLRTAVAGFSTEATCSRNLLSVINTPPTNYLPPTNYSSP